MSKIFKLGDTVKLVGESLDHPGLATREVVTDAITEMTIPPSTRVCVNGQWYFGGGEKAGCAVDGRTAYITEVKGE